MPLTYTEPFDLCRSVPPKPHMNRQLKRKLAGARCNKILIVDDDPILRLGLNVRLRASSYDLCFANDGESAVVAAVAEKPDLIVLDIGLPRGDGYFVMQSITALPELADVPVIVLTARDGFTHEKLCRDAGAKRFFEKPVDNRVLLTAIRELVG